MAIIKEIWKEIDFAPGYFVSNFGKVKSTKFKNERMLKLNKKKNGYLEVGLIVEKNCRKWFLVHRLVAIVFNRIDHFENFEVNHKDENKDNNRIDNLEWVQSKENCNYGTRNFRISIHKECKPVECVETGIIYKSFSEASKKTNINKSRINMCCTGYRNAQTAGGYHWRYA